MKVVKILAKDYVRCKRHVQKFMMMRMQLQAVGLQMQVRSPCACCGCRCAEMTHAWEPELPLRSFLLDSRLCIVCAGSVRLFKVVL